MFAGSRLLIRVAFTLASGLAAPAIAQDAFGTFEALCIATNANSEAAIDGAMALDFGPAPEDVTTGLSAAGLEEVRAVLNNRPMTVVGQGAMAVMTGKMPVSPDPAVPRADVCAVMVYGGDVSVLSQHVTDWLGFEPQGADNHVWAFSIEEGRKVRDPDIHGFPLSEATVARGDLHIVGVSSNGGGASYLFLTLPST